MIIVLNLLHIGFYLGSFIELWGAYAVFVWNVVWIPRRKGVHSGGTKDSELLIV